MKWSTSYTARIDNNGYLKGEWNNRKFRRADGKNILIKVPKKYFHYQQDAEIKTKAATVAPTLRKNAGTAKTFSFGDYYIGMPFVSTRSRYQTLKDSDIGAIDSYMFLGHHFKGGTRALKCDAFRAPGVSKASTRLARSQQAYSELHTGLQLIVEESNKNQPIQQYSLLSREQYPKKTETIITVVDDKVVAIQVRKNYFTDISGEEFLTKIEEVYGKPPKTSGGITEWNGLDMRLIYEESKYKPEFLYIRTIKQLKQLEQNKEYSKHHFSISLFSPKDSGIVSVVYSASLNDTIAKGITKFYQRCKEDSNALAEKLLREFIKKHESSDFEL